MKNQIITGMLVAFFLTGCTLQHGAMLSDEALTQKASAAPLGITTGKVITDNDEAFKSKIRLIENARQSIDLMYYIYSDDYSSSVLTKALLDAARRGVRVRLLVDYHTNYKHLDLYAMMEKEGKGNLQVRFYNRPTKNIVKDAVYVTMGCSKEAPSVRPGACSAEKFAEIDKLFADEQIDGKPVFGRNISNMNVGNSGLFLSGLYSKRPDVMALAVQQGQNIDVKEYKGDAASSSPQERELLKKVGKDYWESKTSPLFGRLEAKASLFFAFAMYGQQLDPIAETFTGILPVDKPLTAERRLDWDHLTDFLHHKLLLVDGTMVQMGGRNVEDSYHMHPNPLTEKYVFMDTDVLAELNQGGEGIVRAFDNLWNFDLMVATLNDVRRHAPNDFVANLKRAEEKCSSRETKEAREGCTQQELQADFADPNQRASEQMDLLERNAATYKEKYALPVQPLGGEGFAIDGKSLLAYLENLPFDKSKPADERTRTYGAPAGHESESGKYIHDTWLAALSDVCASATSENPKQVVLHNAYFFPAANLTYELSRLVKGDCDCSNVTVTVLTNSIETTDLNVVNLAARHALKAFAEFSQEQNNPQKSAKFNYYEYEPPREGRGMSLHSKVSVFGDDIAIGSANADVRSFMMDSNNVMFIRGAGELVKNYLAFVRQILEDPQRARKLNDYFISTRRDVMVQEDLATFRQIMKKYGVDKKMDEAQMKRVEASFVQMLNDSYEMTKQSISRDISASQRRKVQDEFNDKFKPI